MAYYVNKNVKANIKEVKSGAPHILRLIAGGSRDGVSRAAPFLFYMGG